MRTCVICEQKEPKQSMIVDGKEVCLSCAERIAKALWPQRAWGHPSALRVRE